MISFDKQREKLKEIEDRLIDRIAATEDLDFMNLFLKWQTQRETCNKEFFEILNSIKEKKMGKYKMNKPRLTEAVSGTGLENPSDQLQMVEKIFNEITSKYGLIEQNEIIKAIWGNIVREREIMIETTEKNLSELRESLGELNS